MSIFSRTRDIIAANVVDLLDRSDDPAKMIRVIILEMEETLVEVRASAARLIADQKEKRRQVAQLAGLQDNWTERAELALSKDRDDLARAALMEKEKLTELSDELAFSQTSDLPFGVQPLATHTAGVAVGRSLSKRCSRPLPAREW